MNTKAWYLSKTLWLNAIAVLALLLQTKFGFVIDPEAQTGLLALVNLILRAITRQPLEWKPAGTDDVDGEPPHFIPPGTAGFIRLPLLPLILLAGLLALASLPGCASTQSATQPTAATANDSPQILAGKSLLAVKSTIVTSAVAVDSFCKAGKIDAAKCAQAKDAYELAKPAYDSAVDAYLLWSLGHGDQAGFNTALSRAQSLANNLLALSGGIQ